MLLDTGKTRIRNLLNADKEQGIMGTDSTPPVPGDTGLKAPVNESAQPLTSVLATKQITFVYSLNSVTGNGYTYKEYGNRIESGSTFLNRVVFADLPKSVAEEFQISTIVNIP